MFEPGRLGHSPSGLGDWPRPFVFRAGHLDGSFVSPGSSFFFDLNLFDMQHPAIAYLVLAFAQLAREGLGPRRGRADLVAVWRMNEAGEPAALLFDGSTLRQDGTTAMQLSLQPAAAPIEGVTVRFVSPTELKSGDQLTERPQFGVLAARIRDRVSTLRSLYDAGSLEIDFRGFGERAARIRLIRCDIRQIDVVRQSGRTGQVHPIGGFIGEADYEGDLSEFAPFLKAAKWTGVGRQTVWGKGQIEMAVNARQAASHA